MRSLLVALLILAAPFSARAEDGEHGRHGGAGRPYAAAGPQPRYEGGPRRDARGGPMMGPGRYPGPPARYLGPGASGPPTSSGRGPWRSPQEQARDQVRQGRRVPLPQVIARLRRTTGADYVDTREISGPGGRPVYLLRFRQHGRFIDVPVDAETGEVQR